MFVYFGGPLKQIQGSDSMVLSTYGTTIIFINCIYIYMYIGVDKTGKHRVNGLYIDQIKLYVNLIPDLAFCLFKSEHVEWKPMVSE